MFSNQVREELKGKTVSFTEMFVIWYDVSQLQSLTVLAPTEPEWLEIDGRTLTRPRKKRALSYASIKDRAHGHEMQSIERKAAEAKERWQTLVANYKKTPQVCFPLRHLVE